MRSKTKIYPLAAAICYTVFGVYIAVELVEPNFRCGYYFAAFWDTLFFCGLIGWPPRTWLRDTTIAE